jgi:gamma-glutamylputrescine oxidase
MEFNSGLNMAHSYYAATAHPFAACPPLAGEVEADLVVVGGGATGLSAALHAAKAGLSVVILEGGRIGWGASGRNGGQIIPGLYKDAIELVALYGRERGRALFDLALEARDLVVGLIAEHDIECDLKLTGHLLGAAKAGDMHHFEAEARCLADVMAYRDADVLDAAAARLEVDTTYHGALLDRGGGHLHPLNYTLGLARAAVEAGVALHEQSAAVVLEQGARRVRIATASGAAVRARHAVLAGDALLHGLCGRVNSRVVPIASYIAATAPLADPAALIARNRAVSDSKFAANYYRLSADGRLLFGGGERYRPDPPADLAAFVRPHMEAVFPQLRGMAIDHAWGGLVSITMTRMPHLGREGEVLFAHGYSGLGAVLSTLAGKLVVEEIACHSSRFDLFAGIEPPPFPGGAALRGPLNVLGMLWHALKDQLR